MAVERWLVVLVVVDERWAAVWCVACVIFFKVWRVDGGLEECVNKWCGVGKAR